MQPSARPAAGPTSRTVSLSSGLVKLFPEYIDQRLAHPLQIFIALLQEAGAAIGRIIISPVPIAEQRLQRQSFILLSLHDHPVQTGYFIIGKMIEDAAAQQFPGEVN